ncbi:MAG: SGNH/GDSL hydrolase family protein [Deltaproteobacteria bacterium]|nr:SGNH/GDSL hydrolase family protein [Deltaproteobacteria bacterium]
MAHKAKFGVTIAVILTAIFIIAAQPLSAQLKNPETPTIKMIVVFGDSNVDGGLADPGSLFDRSEGKMVRKPNVGGRPTNGPMIIEYLAEMMSVPIRNYAVGGATTGEKNVLEPFLEAGTFPRVRNTGVLKQIAEYADDLKGAKADPKDVFIYWAGSNDIFRSTAKDVEVKITGAVKNIEASFEQLVSLGAKKIIVATRTARPDLRSEDNMFGTRLNEEITKMVKGAREKLKVEIEVFDAYTITADMKNNPSSYGISEPNAPCIKSPKCVDKADVAATYVNWDDIHITTVAHKVMAEKLFQQLKK